MTPNFALSLSFEGIRLLHRSAEGWKLAGDVDLESADLAGDLSRLIETASLLEPHGMRTKLLIPNEQIKYLALDGTRFDEADVRATLDGATPYTVDELVFDFTKGGGRTYIAAVAKETLQEAENFAVEHGFAPISFAAIPEEFTFVGEAFFGPTQAAGGSLVLRDPEPVSVIGVADIPHEDLVDDETFDEVEPEPVEPEALEDEASESEDDEQSTSEKSDVVFTSRSRPSLETTDEPVSAETEAPTQRELTPEGEPIFSSLSRGAADDEVLPTEVEAKVPAVTPDIPPAPADKPLKTPVALADDDQRETPENTAFSTKREKLVAEFRAPSSEENRSSAETGGFFTRRSKTALANSQSEDKDDSASSTSVFGARSGLRKPSVGGKPKYLGLILFALLLLFLLVVAIFAPKSATVSSWFGPNETTTASAPDVEAVAVPVAEPTPEELAEAIPDVVPEIVDVPAPEEEALADAADAEALLPPVDEAFSELVFSEPRVLTPAEAQTIYERTGVWQRAARLPLTPREESSDDIFVAAIDPPSPASDAIALPSAGLTAPDLAFVQPQDPPARGTKFDRDDRGFILATPEGTLLPEGIIVFAGKPSLIPPTRTLPEPEPDPSTVEVSEIAEQTAPAQGPLISPGGVSLASLRPRTRPESLAEQAERDAFGGFTETELAALRPRARPDDLAPQIETDSTAIEAALAGIPFDAETTTELAVATSLRPDSRPNNFSQIVSAARVSPTTVAPTSSVFVAPNGPIPGGVARAATQDNVLALREINLIGITGPSNNLTATVRLANGRIQVVKIGDRLDGGRVVAISASALTYSKRGRNLTLEMPRG